MVVPHDKVEINVENIASYIFSHLLPHLPILALERHHIHECIYIVFRPKKNCTGPTLVVGGKGGGGGKINARDQSFR